MMAYVAGFGGGRERGIQMLKETAAGGRRIAAWTRIFALVLMYNRERRYDDALECLQELRRLHPRNRLVLLEAGSTALRAGRASTAEELLTEGLAMLAADKRREDSGRRGLWRYKRGAARVAFAGVTTQPARTSRRDVGETAGWVQGRARVELARIALAAERRRAAAAEARQAEALCEQGQDPVCVKMHGNC